MSANKLEGYAGTQAPQQSRPHALAPRFPDCPADSFCRVHPRLLYGALLLVMLLMAGIRFRLRNMPLERDEGEYAYAGQLLLQGVPPYKLAYNMKLPGSYAAYAAIMAAFGQTTAGIRLGLILVNAATIVLVFVLAQKVVSPVGGIVAGTTYALLSCLPAVLGFASHATQFVILFALAGIVVLLRACESDGRPLLFFCSGLLLGVAFLMKQPGLAFAAFGAVYIVHDSWKKPRRLALRGMAFLAGVALPFVLTCLILARAGVFHNFWFWTFTYAREYSSETSLAVGWQALQKSLQWVMHPFPLWVFAEIGAVALFWDRRWRPQIFFLLTFTAFSALAVSAGFHFRPHYYILILPAVSILAAVAVTSATCLLSKRSPESAAAVSLAFVPLLLFFVACVVTLWQQRAFLFELAPESAGQKIYAANPFAEAVAVARTVQTLTTPADTIAVFGSEPEIYFYSGRRSATAYIYMYDLVKSQPYQAQMQRELMRQIESARPRVVIYIDDWASWGWLAGHEHDEFFAWMDRYIDEGYELVDQLPINALPAHRWGQSANIYIYRRAESIGENATP